jgi:hypothetical protein
MLQLINAVRTVTLIAVALVFCLRGSAQSHEYNFVKSKMKFESIFTKVIEENDQHVIYLKSGPETVYKKDSPDDYLVAVSKETLAEDYRIILSGSFSTYKIHFVGNQIIIRFGTVDSRTAELTTVVRYYNVATGGGTKTIVKKIAGISCGSTRIFTSENLKYTLLHTYCKHPKEVNLVVLDSTFTPVFRKKLAGEDAIKHPNVVVTNDGSLLLFRGGNMIVLDANQAYEMWQEDLALEKYDTIAPPGMITFAGFNTLHEIVQPDGDITLFGSYVSVVGEKGSSRHMVTLTINGSTYEVENVHFALGGGTGGGRAVETLLKDDGGWVFVESMLVNHYARRSEFISVHNFSKQGNLLWTKRIVHGLKADKDYVNLKYYLGFSASCDGDKLSVIYNTRKENVGISESHFAALDSMMDGIEQKCDELGLDPYDSFEALESDWKSVLEHSYGIWARSVSKTITASTTFDLETGDREEKILFSGADAKKYRTTVMAGFCHYIEKGQKILLFCGKLDYAVATARTKVDKPKIAIVPR